MGELKKSKITVEVATNENNLPEAINWSAQDGGVDAAEAKAVIMSFWDPKEMSAMRMDIWTPDFSVDEMKQFFHQTLLTMADTFERATGEKNITDDLRDYCYHFAEKMNILPPLS